MRPLDDGFVYRVYRTSGMVILVVGLCLLSLGQIRPVLGLLSGSGLMLGCIYVTDQTIRRVLRPGALSLKPLNLVLLCLYACLFGALVLLGRLRFFDLPAFLGGVELPLAVILLKTLGRRFLDSK